MCCRHARDMRVVTGGLQPCRKVAAKSAGPASPFARRMTELPQRIPGCGRRGRDTRDRSARPRNRLMEQSEQPFHVPRRRCARRGSWWATSRGCTPTGMQESRVPRSHTPESPSPSLPGGELDFADNEIDDAVDEIALVRDVVVQRHRLDTSRGELRIVRTRSRPDPQVRSRLKHALSAERTRCSVRSCSRPSTSLECVHRQAYGTLSYV
jgi:hypothetical protein